MRTTRQPYTQQPVFHHGHSPVSPNGQPPYWNGQQMNLMIASGNQPIGNPMVPPAYQPTMQMQGNFSLTQQGPVGQEQGFSNPYPTYGKWTKQKVADSVFTNPLHQEGYFDPYTGLKPNEPKNYANPYPKMNPIAKPKQSGVSSVMNSFKNQDGSMNMNKMMDTAGQVMSAVNQMSGMIKGVGSIFKGFGG